MADSRARRAAAACARALLLLAVSATACDRGAEDGATAHRASEERPVAHGAAEQRPVARGADGERASGQAAARDGVGALAPVETLRELGYVDFAAADGDARSGVVLLDEQRSSPGYDLCTSIAFARAVLRERGGTEVHRWTGPADARWTRCELLDDGDLLVVGLGGGPGGAGGAPPDGDAGGPAAANGAAGADDDAGPATSFVMRIGWDGAPRWRRADLSAHHDVELAPDGHVVVLTERVRHDRPHLAPQGVRDHLVTRLDARDGAVVDELSLLDAFAARPDLVELRGDERAGGRSPANLIHANSVEWMARPALAARDPLFGPDHVLVSCRGQDTIAVLHWPSRALVWAWGRGEVQLQHEATVTDEGRVLLFDNGTAGRGYSRVVELDPLGRRITWQFTTPDPERFFSPARGTVQPLPDGNVLVGNSGAGEAFEVTRAGRLVWHFLNPDRDERTGARGALRIKRYPVPLVERLLGRR